MRIIKPSVEYTGPVPTDYVGALKHIERCGRLCYRSEDKITDTSAAPFVKRLIKAGHLAMVEHSNFVVRAKAGHFVMYPSQLGKYITPFTDPEYYYLGGNITAWLESSTRWGIKDQFKVFYNAYGEVLGLPKTIAGYKIGWSPGGDAWQVCPHDEIPKELHRYSVKFICDRGVSHELVRHRPCSFAQESTRYVNYGGKEMEFIEPAEYGSWTQAQRNNFEVTLHECEHVYNNMLIFGCKPQQARAVLPNALKTEIVVTADAAEWMHIRKLRTDKAAHPDMVRVMNMVPWEDIT
jgi:thymidylate synthase (FAD)